TGTGPIASNSYPAARPRAGVVPRHQPSGGRSWSFLLGSFVQVAVSRVNPRVSRPAMAVMNLMNHLRRRPLQPAAPEAGAAQPRNHRRAAAHEVPDEAGAVVFNHQHHRPLVDAELV